MDIDVLIESIHTDLRRGYVSAPSLTSRLPYVPTRATKSPSFTDPTYYPAYFHLGKRLQPKKVFEASLGGGVPVSCLLLGCERVEHVLAFQEQSDEFYSVRLAKHNIRQAYRKKLDLHVGLPTDQRLHNLAAHGPWDAVLVNSMMDYDKHLAYMRLLWPYISSDGVMIVDYINYHKAAGRAYDDFCLSYGKRGSKIKSKYGLGLIIK